MSFKDDLLKSHEVNQNDNGILHIKNNLKKDSNTKNGFKAYETSTLNGILKNGATKQNGASGGQPKNISFGGVKQ